ncbi:MAG: hypothetical protein GX061_08075 [Eubacteriaceae bacterium]|nr:hypothetical protein [Eubacteriaceae bacterium]
MSKKNGFGFGVIVGLAVGIAAKYLLDNKEEVKAVAGEKIAGVKEGVGDAMQYASGKISTLAGGFVEKVSDYIEYAKEQFNEIKQSLLCNECDCDECCCDDDCDCDDDCECKKGEQCCCKEEGTKAEKKECCCEKEEKTEDCADGVCAVEEAPQDKPEE